MSKCRTKAILSLALGAFVCGIPFTGICHAQIAEVAVLGTPPVSEKPESFFGSLAKKFMIYLSDRPFFINEKDIDQIVGDPRTLEPSTAAKLRLLPARLRLNLYGVINANPGSFTFIPPAPGAGGAMVLEVDPETTTKMVESVQSTFSDHFRTEELVDLGVYFLSTTPLFPKTEDGWRDFKRGVIATDMILAAAYAVTMATTNNGKLKASGWLVKLPGDKFRIGWYGGIRHLGLAWHPDWTAGVQATGDLIDISVGVKKHVNAGPTDEKTAFEAEIREHWLGKFSRLWGWETSLHASVRLITDHGDPRHDHTAVVSADLFAKKPMVFGRRELNLIMSGKFTTDFIHTTSGEGSIGIEHGDTGLAGAFSVAGGHDDLTGSSLRMGFFIDGTLDGDSHHAEKDVSRAGSYLRHDVEYMDRLDQEYRDVEKGLSLYRGVPADAATAKRDRVIIEDLHQREKWIIRGLEALRRRLHTYLDLWHHQCAATGVPKGKCHDEDGPLDERVLTRAHQWVRP